MFKCVFVYLFFSTSSKRQDRAGARIQGTPGSTGGSYVTNERDDITKTQIATADRCAAKAEQGVHQSKSVYGTFRGFTRMITVFYEF